LKIKLNAVALKDFNEDEMPEMMRFAHGRGMDLTVIETMPMGEIEEDRTDRYLPLSELRADLEEAVHADEIGYRTGGPARYVERQGNRRPLGFITPMTHNFCESCNRVRLTCTGTLYMCLGQNDAADLRTRCAPPKTTPALRRHRRSDHAQAQGPRLHHRPHPQPPRRRPPHERHRRVSLRCITQRESASTFIRATRDRFIAGVSSIRFP
jgi:molybdenum cofactor biosynthesis enzyme MoaA